MTRRRSTIDLDTRVEKACHAYVMALTAWRTAKTSSTIVDADMSTAAALADLRNELDRVERELHRWHLTTSQQSKPPLVITGRPPTPFAPSTSGSFDSACVRRLTLSETD